MTKPKKKQAKKELLSCPEELGEIGRNEWKRITKELNLEALDRTAALMYCSSFEEYFTAIQKLKEENNEFVKTSEDGGQYYSMWLAVKRHAHGDMLKMMRLLGLSPLDRSNLMEVNPAAFKHKGNKDVNPFEAL